MKVLQALWRSYGYEGLTGFMKVLRLCKKSPAHMGFGNDFPANTYLFKVNK